MAKKKLPKPPKASYYRAHSDYILAKGMYEAAILDEVVDAKDRLAELQRELTVALNNPDELAWLRVDELDHCIDRVRDRITELQTRDDIVRDGITLKNHYLLLPLAYVYEHRGDKRSMIACISVWLAIRHGRRVTSNVLTLPYVSPQVLQAAIEYYEQSGWRKQFEGEGLRAVVNTSHN